MWQAFRLFFFREGSTLEKVKKIIFENADEGKEIDPPSLRPAFPRSSRHLIAFFFAREQSFDAPLSSCGVGSNKVREKILGFANHFDAQSCFFSFLAASHLPLLYFFFKQPWEPAGEYEGIHSPLLLAAPSLRQVWLLLRLRRLTEKKQQQKQQQQQQRPCPPPPLPPSSTTTTSSSRTPRPPSRPRPP